MAKHAQEAMSFFTLSTINNTMQVRAVCIKLVKTGTGLVVKVQDWSSLMI